MKEKKWKMSFWEMILAVIAIALIILTLGWLAKNWKYITASELDHFEKDELADKQTKLLEVENELWNCS